MTPRAALNIEDYTGPFVHWCLQKPAGAPVTKLSMPFSAARAPGRTEIIHMGSSRTHIYLLPLGSGGWARG